MNSQALDPWSNPPIQVRGEDETPAGAKSQGEVNQRTKWSQWPCDRTGENGDFMVISWDLPSGKHRKNYGKIHHAING